MTTQYPQISINSEKWMNSPKNYWGKKGTFGARSRCDNRKGPTESFKYYGNTVKAMADIGRSNSVLRESAGKKGDGPVFRENNHANSHLQKKV